MRSCSRQGSSCTTRELFTAIFEDEPYEKKLQNLLQTYIFAMIKAALKAAEQYRQRILSIALCCGKMAKVTLKHI